MANKQLQIELQLKTDAAKKALTDLTNMSRQALNPNSSTSAFVKENQALDQMNAKLKLLVGVQSQLANQKGMSQEYGRVSTEIANILNRQKQMVTTEEQYLKVLQAETNARKAAAAVKQPSSSGGGGIQQGASQIFGAAGLPGGGLIGATGPLGAFTAALSGANKMLSEFGSKAEDLSKVISDSGGPLDQLRQSTIDLKQAQDKLIDDPAIAAVQKFKNELETAGLQFLKGAIDEFSTTVHNISDWADRTFHGTKALSASVFGDAFSKAKDDEQKKTNLIGKTKVEYENLMHERVAMEKEIAMQEQEFAIETQRKKRDLALETKEFEIEQARKQADLEKQLARENQDYQIEKQKLTQDQAFKTSQEKFKIDQQFELRAFQQKQQDEKQNLQLKLADAQQDYNLQQSFKAQDYAKDAARRGEDFAQNLTRMGMTGASGTDYLFAAQDFSKTNRRAAEDYAIEQGRNKTEFGIKQGRDVRDFNISQGREARDFNQNREKTLKEHTLDVEQHYYELKLQTNELEIKHARALQDINTNLERLAQDTAIGRQKLANKASDLTQDTALTRQKMDFDESEKRRSQSMKEMDFGGSLVDQVPIDTLQKLMKSNPDIAKFILGDLSRKGQNVPGLNAPASNKGKNTAEQTGKGVADFYSDTAKNVGDLSGVIGPWALAAAPAFAAKNGMSDVIKPLAKALFGIDIPFFADGGYYDLKRPGPAILHPGELVLNENQQKALFTPGSHTGLGYGPGGASGVMALNPSDHAGFGYGRGGATGLSPIGMPSNNGTANGAPVSPINMPGSGSGPVQPIQINMGNDSYQLSGGSATQLEQQLRDALEAKIANVMSQYQSGMFKSMQRMSSGGY